MDHENSCNDIVDPTDISCFRAKPIINAVQRDSLLNTIDNKFENNIKIILICGDKGMGKSELLCQFLNRNKKHCIALFIDVINKQSYCEENIIRDLYKQISFYINGVEPTDIVRAGASELSSILYLLESYLRKNKRNMYFLVDGLDEIPLADQYIINGILDAMPFNTNNIKFIFSSSSSILSTELYRLKFIKIEMVMYTEYEVIKALYPLDESVVREILKVYKAVPEQIDTIKRLIENGMNPEEIIQNYSNDTADLVKAEWDRASEVISENKSFFALIAFAIQPLKIVQIINILEIKIDSIEAIIESVGFVVIEKKSIKFITNGIKEYAKIQLQHLENDSINHIISNFDTISDEISQLSDINLYHELQENYPAIIEQLSDTNISLVFKTTNSINDVVKQVKLGLKSANEVNSTQDILRFSNTQSILFGMLSSELLKSELQCHLSDDNYKSALSLISSSNK